MVQALVPLKDLVQAKTRLAGVLRPSERRALAQAMVEDVLGVLAAHHEIDGIVLVSDDPGAHLLADRYGARYWPEAEFRCRGLNPLVTGAVNRLLDENQQHIVVLHGDLPLLCDADISEILFRQREGGGLVIGCDRAGTGTNMLAFDRQSVPEFCFGEDSCRKHLAAAASRGIPARVLRREGAGFDVDDPADLAALLPRLSRIPGRQTAKLLMSATLNERIRLALDTLDGVACGPEERGEQDRQ